MAIEARIRKDLPGFHLEVEFSGGNERLGLLGASGCGKSMTLRCIAGIVEPDEGTIVIDGQVVFDRTRGRTRVNLPPRERRVGYLFQHYALVPTMTVGENMRLGIWRSPRTLVEGRVRAMLDRLGLDGLAERRPEELSGGQQQRVALGRMLLSDPRIIMLDEPLSALDSWLRSRVEQELLQTLEGFAGTILFVSHDRDEVYRICNRLVVLEDGSVAAAGTRDDVFERPRTVGSARLTGCRNIAPAVPSGDRTVAVPEWGLVLRTSADLPPGLGHVGIRAHHIREAVGDEDNAFSFRVGRISQAPFTLTEFLEPILPHGYGGHGPLLGGLLQREVPGLASVSPAHREGSMLRLCLPPEHLLLLD